MALAIHSKCEKKMPAQSMYLSGHSGAVYSAKFNPQATLAASAGHDRNILLWSIFSTDIENIATLKGHKEATLDLSWAFSGDQIFSCSADRTAILWDLQTLQKTKTCKEHTGIVNSIASSRFDPNLILTTSNDQSAKLWDVRSKKSVHTIEEEFPIISCALSPNFAFCAGIDPSIRLYDLRTHKLSSVLKDHRDQMVCSLSLSPQNSNNLLSISLDGTMNLWDLSPYFNSETRLLQKFFIASTGDEQICLKGNIISSMEKNFLVAVGSNDSFAYVFGQDGMVEHRLPGHKGTVIEANISQDSNLLLSCGTDGKIFVTDLSSVEKQ